MGRSYAWIICVIVGICSVECIDGFSLFSLFSSDDDAASTTQKSATTPATSANITLQNQTSSHMFNGTTEDMLESTAQPFANSTPIMEVKQRDQIPTQSITDFSVGKLPKLNLNKSYQLVLVDASKLPARSPGKELFKISDLSFGDTPELDSFQRELTEVLYIVGARAHLEETETTEKPKVQKRELASKKYGDSCVTTYDCEYTGGYCDPTNKICVCHPQYRATDHTEQCARGVSIYEKCSFDEQCEFNTANAMCQDGICVCRGKGTPELQSNGEMKCKGKKFGDKCLSTDECGFKHAICEPNKNTCQCQPQYTATNHIDKCGTAAEVDEECFFNEQCEQAVFHTICLNGRCACRSEGTPLTQPDGTVKCVVVNPPTNVKYVDPAMIIVLSGMCLMFIIICVVLHLFSKARWHENRTIFNTPNPRLMNVSLLREKQKGDRRGSKGSKEGPSRDPSLASLRQHSPSVESRTITSRRESRAANNGTAKSPISKIPPSLPPYTDLVGSNNTAV